MSKNVNMTKKTEENPLVIPFIKAVRIANFKLWRSKYAMKSGNGKIEIECIHVSSLDGSWTVRIPATTTMFSLIANGYATVDEALREQFLDTILVNIYNCSTSGSEALHDAFFFLTEMMSFPYLLLSEKEMRSRMEKGMKELGYDKAKRKEHIDHMCDYRRQLYELIENKKNRLIENYEKQQAEQRANQPQVEKEMEQDEIAEEAMNILNEEQGN